MHTHHMHAHIYYGKHPYGHNLMHTCTLYRPPETCSSNKDSKSAHINTLPHSVCNTEMVSTCHVNLLSSPAAFHMHYTPERTVSFSLLLDFKLSSAHLAFLFFCVQIITNASRMTWSPWISTSWKQLIQNQGLFKYSDCFTHSFFHWWNSPLCSPLMYEALKYLCISSP